MSFYLQFSVLLATVYWKKKCFCIWHGHHCSLHTHCYRLLLMTFAYCGVLQMLKTGLVPYKSIFLQLFYCILTD